MAESVVDGQPVELQQIQPKPDENEQPSEDQAEGQGASVTVPHDADHHPEPGPEQPEQQEQQQESVALRSIWNGQQLHVQTWIPADAPRAILYLCHGTGEHMGRYEKIGTLLAENGFLVYGHDYVGHGKSEGDRVHVETMDTYVMDVIQHVEIMKKQYPELPSFIMGHSMGGLVSLFVTLKRPELFLGLVLSSPMVEIDPASAGAFTQLLARILGFLLPQVGVKPINPNFISSVPEEEKMYADDPLIYHDSLKAGWASAAMKAIKLIRERVGEIHLPMFIMHGTDDHLIPFSASQFIFDNIGTPKDKTFEAFEGSYHEILHDKDQERARELIKDWLLAHLSQQEKEEQE